jgi:hypothetical protein
MSFVSPNQPTDSPVRTGARTSPLGVRVPFLRQAVGAGDVIAGATKAAGIQPCEPCEERRRRLNELLQLQPWGDAR